MEKMELLEKAYEAMHLYTTDKSGWRPGLVDLAVYNQLINMHEDDQYDVDNPTFIWKHTPDECMEYIINSGYIFEDLEFGLEALYESIRDYLIKEGLIVDIEDLSDEEYNKLTGGNK